MIKRIIWITGDYFVDVDISIVPYLREYYGLKIDWYIIKGKDSKIEMPKAGFTKIYELRYKGSDPRIISDYKGIFDDIDLCNSDLIYSDYVGVPYYYPYLHLYTGKKQPIVHAAHNVIPYKVWPFSLICYVKYVCRYNNHFHLFSSFTADYFRKRYTNKSIFYAPMTLKGYGKISTNNYCFNPQKVNLLFFGNVIDNKRLDLLIDAIKDLPVDYKKKVQLYICGKCDNSQKYLNLINGDKTITTYFQHIKDNEVAELFTKSSFLILPYEAVAQSGPHMVAYYYNLPVIATDIDGFTERVEDEKNGFLFKVNDKKSLMSTIIKATELSNEAYCLMKSNLSNYSEKNFSLEKLSIQYVEYFKSVIN